MRLSTEDAVRGDSALKKSQMKDRRKASLQHFTDYDLMCKEMKDAVTQLQCCVEDRLFGSEQHPWSHNTTFLMVLPCAG